MVFHMKTTLNIREVTMRRLKAEAARQRRTMSELVDEALRASLRKKTKLKKLPPLPSFDGGKFLVDVADREALFKAMEE